MIIALDVKDFDDATTWLD